MTDPAHAEDFHLVETMRHEPATGVRQLPRHLARLERSAAFYGFDVDVTAIREALIARPAGRGDARVRLSAFRDGSWTIECAPLPAPAAGMLVLAVDDEPVDAREHWPHHKTSRRAPYRRRAARHPDADDVVLVNHRGEVTETTIANLAVHLDGRWWTPPSGCGCLPGVERARLLDVGVLAERIVRPDELRSAHGLALVSALRGWRPARLAPQPRLDRHGLLLPGPGTHPAPRTKT